MAPKPKKAKKTKAEIEEERLAREEEERKAKLLEEKRLAEEKEKKRLEELRIQAEQHEFRKQELERLREEFTSYNDDIKSRKYQLDAEEKKEAAQMEWLRFINPSDEPDARQDSDMNTFITLMREAPVKELKDALEQIGHIVQVAAAMSEVWSLNLSNSNLLGQQQSVMVLDTLRVLIQEKLDSATVKLLRFADSQLNEKQELSLEEVSGTFSVGMWANYNEIRPIRKSVQLERVGVHLDIPKQLLSQNEKFVYRLVRMPISTYNFSAYSSGQESSSKSKFIVGDVIVFDILYTAPASTYLRAKRWTIRDKSASSTTLRRTHYPSSVACRMVLKIPDEIAMTEDIRAAIWSEDAKDWVEDGISDFTYNENNRTAQFYITTVGTIALVKHRNADLPYKKWTLAPVLETTVNKEAIESFSFGNSISASAATIYPPMYEKHARFTIQTQKQELVIDIIGSKCILIQPDSKIFADLIGKVMSPAVLLTKLQYKGINLMPTLLELKSVEGYKPKVSSLEAHVLNEVSSGASSFEFSCNATWNQFKCSDSQIGILMRETCVYSAPEESYDYECVLAERDVVSTSYLNAPDLGFVDGNENTVKFMLVFGNEYGTKGDEYSNKLRVNEQGHIELCSAVKNKVTKQATERYKKINPRFEKTVNTLLSLIKPFSLC